jgi:hypothetical protein
MRRPAKKRSHSSVTGPYRSEKMRHFYGEASVCSAPRQSPAASLSRQSVSCAHIAEPLVTCLPPARFLPWDTFANEILASALALSDFVAAFVCVQPVPQPLCCRWHWPLCAGRQLSGRPERRIRKCLLYHVDHHGTPSSCRCVLLRSSRHSASCRWLRLAIGNTVFACPYSAAAIL